MQPTDARLSQSPPPVPPAEADDLLQSLLSVPLGPGLSAMARYVHAECQRRGVIPADYSLVAFLQDAVYERVYHLLTIKLLDYSGGLRLMTSARRYEDAAADTQGRLLLIGIE